MKCQPPQNIPGLKNPLYRPNHFLSNGEQKSDCRHLYRAIDQTRSQCAKCGKVTK